MLDISLIIVKTYLLLEKEKEFFLYLVKNKLENDGREDYEQNWNSKLAKQKIGGYDVWFLKSLNYKWFALNFEL